MTGIPTSVYLKDKKEIVQARAEREHRSFSSALRLIIDEWEEWKESRSRTAETLHDNEER